METTKKIQEQTKNIEVEIKKFQELLMKQQEFKYTKSLSKKALLQLNHEAQLQKTQQISNSPVQPEGKTPLIRQPFHDNQIGIKETNNIVQPKAKVNKYKNQKDSIAELSVNLQLLQRTETGNETSEVLNERNHHGIQEERFIKSRESLETTQRFGGIVLASSDRHEITNVSSIHLQSKQKLNNDGYYDKIVNMKERGRSVKKANEKELNITTEPVNYVKVSNSINIKEPLYKKEDNQINSSKSKHNQYVLIANNAKKSQDYLDRIEKKEMATQITSSFYNESPVVKRKLRAHVHDEQIQVSIKTPPQIKTNNHNQQQYKEHQLKEVNQKIQNHHYKIIGLTNDPKDQESNVSNGFNDSFYQSLQSKKLYALSPGDQSQYGHRQKVKNPSLITEARELKEELSRLKEQEMAKQKHNSHKRTVPHSNVTSHNYNNYNDYHNQSQKRIPDLNYIQRSPKQQIVMNTFLTPIVFVSKDYQMRADYILDSEVENIRNSFTLRQQQLLMHNTEIQKQLQDREGGIFPPLYNNHNRAYQNPNEKSAIINVQNQDLVNTFSPKRKSRSTVRGQEYQQQFQVGSHNFANNQQNNYSFEEEIKESEPVEQQDELGITQNNFYESIRVEMPDDFTILDNEIKVLCRKLEFYLQSGNSRIDLTMNTLRLKHPIFKMISISAFNYLIEKSYLFNLKNNQGAYKEGLKAQKNIYFVLFGTFKLEKQRTGDFGDLQRCGYTIGEEILFISDDVVHRIESCLAIGGEAALLQVNVDDLIKMSTLKHSKGGGTSMFKDFQTLMGILFYNYEQKQQWRDEVNINNELQQVDV